MTTEPSISRSKPLFGCLVVVAIFAAMALLLSISVYVISFGGHLGGTQESWGQFGDYLGGVLNPLLGFAGLIAILYTIKLQADSIALSASSVELTREDLRLQVEEMRQSRIELAAQTKVQRAQFHAAVHQIRVAAEEAKIEALAVYAEGSSHGRKEETRSKIFEASEKIEALADSLGQQVLE